MARTPDHDSIVWISIPLDGETAARLRELSDACHASEHNVAASLLHDVLRDDAEAHHLLNAPAASPVFN